MLNRLYEAWRRQTLVFNFLVGLGAATAVFTAPNQISQAVGHPMTMPEMGQALSQNAFNTLNPDAKVLGQMQFTAKDFKK